LEEEAGEKHKSDEPDPTDFLSSIEIVLMTRADVILMQNWSHVTKIFEALNQIPKQQHSTDIMRLREQYVAGKARCYRQNIIFGSFESPEVNALFSRFCPNHAGIAKWTKVYKGVLPLIVPQLRHTFEPLRPALKVPADDPEARFETFKSSFWPRIRDASRAGGQLLYIPSYFDFVRVRNYLREQAASFVTLSEYSDRKDMARARSYFADGRRRVLVYTERAQFYNRHRIRGIKDIYFYQLPQHPQFYNELANYIEEDSIDSAMATVSVMYSRFDLFRLERVVGTDRAKKMAKKCLKGSAAGTFVFC